MREEHNQAEEDGDSDDQCDVEEEDTVGRGGEMQLDEEEEDTEQDGSFESGIGLNSSLTSNNTSSSSPSISNAREVARTYAIGSRQSFRGAAKRSIALTSASSSSSSSAENKGALSEIKMRAAASKDVADALAKSVSLKKAHDKQAASTAASFAANQNLVAENKSLVAQNKSLGAQNKTETTRLKKLNGEVQKIEGRIESLDVDVTQLKCVLESGQAEIKTLKQEQKKYELVNLRLQEKIKIAIAEHENLRGRPRNILK